MQSSYSGRLENHLLGFLGDCFENQIPFSEFHLCNEEDNSCLRLA